MAPNDFPNVVEPLAAGSAGAPSAMTESGAWHDRIPLRLRIGLFFLLISLGGIAAMAGGALLALSRLDPQAVATAQGPLTISVVVGALGLAALCAWVWLMFDENVARPLLRLAGALRTRARAASGGTTAEARYLGALAPAAAEVGAALDEARAGLDAQVAFRTAELARQTHQLEAVLADLAEGVVVCSPDHRIVLCNGQARRMLAPFGEAGLGRVLGPGAADPITEGLSRLRNGAPEPLRVLLPPAPDAPPLRGRLAMVRGEGGDEGYVLTLRDPLGDEGASADVAFGSKRRRLRAERPEFYDFGLLDRERSTGAQARLDRAVFVVFDTETTGLRPAAGDALVQIGAVRVAGGRVLREEGFETLVDPGRPIPAASTAVHGIDDSMTAGAPSAEEAVAAFHRFAEGSVLVAHNAPFDLAFVRKAEAAAGARFDHPVLDTVLLSAAAWPNESDHTLDGLASRLGIEADPELRHTAMGDAVMTAAAFVRLIPLLAHEGCETVADAEARCLAQGALRRKQAFQAATV